MHHNPFLIYFRETYMRHAHHKPYLSHISLLYCWGIRGNIFCCRFLGRIGCISKRNTFSGTGILLCFIVFLHMAFIPQQLYSHCCNNTSIHTIFGVVFVLMHTRKDSSSFTTSLLHSKKGNELLTFKSEDLKQTSIPLMLSLNLLKMTCLTPQTH
jgi:hypothetical protein